MLISYVRIAWRHILAAPAVSLISVLSLALGTTCALILFVFLEHESVRDNYHVNGDRLFRICSANESAKAWARNSASVPVDMGPRLKDSFPQIEEIVRWRSDWGRLRLDDFTSRFRLAYVDSTFFSSLTIEFLHGDPNPFSTPNEVILTPTTARRFVGDGDIAKMIGRRLVFFAGGDDAHEVVVSAITYDIPYQSSMWFEALLPLDLMPRGDESSYDDNVMTLAMLHSPDQRVSFEEGLPAFAARYFEKDLKSLRDRGKWKEKRNPFTLFLQPISEMYANNTSGGNNYLPEILINMIAFVGGLVLLLGCVNFTVLSLGRATGRSKEIGLRKVSGAYRSHIVGQLVLEAIFLSAVAMVLGAALAQFLLPEVSSLFPLPHYALKWTYTPISWAFLVLLPVLLGVLSGFYPAYTLSGVDPVSSLKGETRLGGRNRLSRILVVVQFSASIFLLASTQIFLSQMHHIQSIDRGFDMSTLLAIEANSIDHRKHHEAFKTRASSIPGVDGVFGVSVSVGLRAERYTTKEDGIQMNYLGITSEFLSTLNLKIVRGRDLWMHGPVAEVVVNERLVEAMKWDDPIGQVVPFTVGQVDHPSVVGVVEDFHFTAPSAPIMPLLLHQDPTNNTGRTYVKIAAGQVGTLRPQLEELWLEVAPNAPSSIEMLDEMVHNQGAGIHSMFRSLGYAASFFGTIISCLGLFGLALHTLSRRSKEIGVRKVLGASMSSVFVLLSRRLLTLAVIGCALGSVASFYAVQSILQGFAKQVPVGITTFVWPTLGVTLLASLSIAYHTFKSACIDPSVELRSN